MRSVRCPKSRGGVMAATAVGAKLSRVAIAVLAATAIQVVRVGTTGVSSESVRYQRKSRQVSVYPNTRLPSIVLPDDDFVVVKRGGPGLAITVDTYVPTRDEDLTHRARNADVIVVAELVRSNS